MTKVTGGCLCGKIRYEINAQPLRIANCHCEDCRKATGSTFATNVFYKQDDVKITQGKPSQYAHKAASGNTVIKEFCPDCGSQLFGSGTLRPGIKHIKAGTLDTNDFVKPTINVYLSSALKCTLIDEGLDNYQQMPSA